MTDRLLDKTRHYITRTAAPLLASPPGGIAVALLQVALLPSITDALALILLILFNIIAIDIINPFQTSKS